MVSILVSPFYSPGTALSADFAQITGIRWNYCQWQICKNAIQWVHFFFDNSWSREDFPFRLNPSNLLPFILGLWFKTGFWFRRRRFRARGVLSWGRLQLHRIQAQFHLHFYGFYSLLLVVPINSGNRPCAYLEQVGLINITLLLLVNNYPLPESSVLKSITWTTLNELNGATSKTRPTMINLRSRHFVGGSSLGEYRSQETRSLGN